MRRLILCNCGSGKDQVICCGPIPQVKVRKFPINCEQERKEVLQNIQISSQFNMRYRGLFEYYGKDLIAYKREKPRDQNRNEFLRIISIFMSFYLEDTCPTSWENCQPSFWEELMITIFPLHMHVTPQKKEVEKFLHELKKFVRWLDRRVGTSWSLTIENHINKYHDELKMCEVLLNTHFLLHFPQIHKSDNWDPLQNIKKLKEDSSEFNNTINSIFKICSTHENTTVLKDISDDRDFYVIGLDCNQTMEGILLDCSIGKKDSDIYWHWLFTEGVYPGNTSKYISFD
ncbi:hypothetical protein KHA94_19500 [Bacillus sp. FJAT-49705]|uniref:SEC-C motif-containing protein n=1 Tax=Cytobacillus citreus TaxID=2833586 RepID=A0ABS5NZ40_9BACI|nr:hypothetical protein [Cytobacillus citreus]MBS4192348.1 hypothetical protein [Cytobacillus citreus]